MTAIHVEITAEDVEAARALPSYDAWSAPVEAAIGRLTGQDVSIDGSDATGNVATIGAGIWTVVVDLPDTANDWLNAFWRDRAPGEPFAFDIEIDDWLVALITQAIRPDLVTLAEAAEALDLQPQTLRSAANQLRDGVASEDALAGRLGILRVGRDWLVPRDRLEAEVARRDAS